MLSAKLIFTTATSAALLLVCCCFSAMPVTALQGSFSPVRNISGGTISGKYDVERNVGVWLGIPFAAPPVGALRFSDPKPPQAWSGVLQTTAFGPGCMALCDFPHPEFTCAKTVSENCLSLNIWSPSPAPVKPRSPTALPVFIFVPGGRYQFGAGGCPLYNGAEMSRNQNIIIVTINYRLGAFGALTTSRGIRGNFMLKDQRLAMQWVQQNIHMFGGNAGRVTIGGESAGAMSVGSHLVSPKSRGLFKAAVMSSNPYGDPYQDVKLATELGDKYVKKAGCAAAASLSAQLECLSKIDAKLLLNYSQDTNLFPWPSTILADLVPWTPTVDNSSDELPAQPMSQAGIDMVSSDISITLGNNANDSVLFVGELPGAAKLDYLEAEALVLTIWGIKNGMKINKLYKSLKAVSSTPLLWFSRITTDYLFSCPNRWIARQFANRGGTAYFYLFDLLPSFSKWMWDGSKMSICATSICHADDLPLMWNTSYLDPSAPALSPADLAASVTLQGAWGGMVRSGKPTVDPAWTPMSASGAYNRYNIGAPNSNMMNNYHSEFCDFFDTIGYSRR